jgi:hypothetical protein
VFAEDEGRVRQHLQSPEQVPAELFAFLGFELERRRGIRELDQSQMLAAIKDAIAPMPAPVLWA